MIYNIIILNFFSVSQSNNNLTSYTSVDKTISVRTLNGCVVLVQVQLRVASVLGHRFKDRPGSLFQPGPGPGSVKMAGTGILPGPGL